MAYATGADLVKRYDAHNLGELISDTGVRVPAASVPTNANVAAALDDASADVDMACRVGQRYAAADLAALAADAQKKSQLVRLVCDLAAGYLVQRRNLPTGEVERLVPGFGRALQTLELLRRGERVFDVGEAPAAGVTVEPVVPLDAENALLSQGAFRYFGVTPVNSAGASDVRDRN